MFFPLASCMLFLPVISFVHRCLPLAVPVCPQSSISLPSIRWDFLFTWLIPSRYIPARLGSPCASVPGNPASRGGFARLSPLRGAHWSHGALPAASCCACVRAGALGKGCAGVSRSLWLPAAFSLCLAFAAQLGGSLLPPAARVGSTLLLPQPGGGWGGSRPRASCPCPALRVGNAPGSLGGGVREQRLLLQGGAAAGAAGAESEQFRDGQGNEMLDLRQGERFQNRKRGEGFLCSLLPLELSLV